MILCIEVVTPGSITTWKNWRESRRWHPLHQAWISRLWQLPHSCPPLLALWMPGFTGNPFPCGPGSRAFGAPGCRDNTAFCGLRQSLEPSVRCAPNCWLVQPTFCFSSSAGSWWRDATFHVPPNLKRTDVDELPWWHSVLLYSSQLTCR